MEEMCFGQCFFLITSLFLFTSCAAHNPMFSEALPRYNTSDINDELTILKSQHKGPADTATSLSTTPVTYSEHLSSSNPTGIGGNAQKLNDTFNQTQPPNSFLSKDRITDRVQISNESVLGTTALDGSIDYMNFRAQVNTNVLSDHGTSQSYLVNQIPTLLPFIKHYTNPKPVSQAINKDPLPQNPGYIQPSHIDLAPQGLQASFLGQNNVERRSNISEQTDRFDANITVHFDGDLHRIESVHSTSQTAINHASRKERDLPDITLYIGGLFELRDKTNTTSNSTSESDAASMAIDQINQQRFIPGYRLQLVRNDTRCEPGFGADAFFDLVYRKPTMMMLITSSCSEVTKMLGEIVPYWNLILVSVASTSPALSDREKYPTIYRLAAADSSHNAARKKFIQHFGWDTVATLTQDQETYTLAIDEIVSDFEKTNITLKSQQTFRDEHSVYDIRAKLKALKETDARIILGSFTEFAAHLVFCEAYRLGMISPRYVWMLVGGYTKQWWRQNSYQHSCSVKEMDDAVDGHMTVEALNTILGDKRSIGGMTTKEFFQEYARLGLKTPRSAFASVTYDTIWTVAMALKQTMHQWQAKNELRLENFEYKTTGPQMLQDFFTTMGKLEFTGVSGPISFDGPDRRGTTVLRQVQGGDDVRVALFYPENNSLHFDCIGCQKVVWKGGKVPADKYTIVIRAENIHPLAFYAVSAVGAFGIILANIFLAFNLYNRKLKYIKLSSPALNNVAVVGCMLAYLAVIFLGFDDATISSKTFPFFCSMRAFLLAAGYSLAFGAMFTKTYRVHQIVTRAHNGLMRSKLLKDKQLLLIIGALLILDTIIIVVWVIVDPMQKMVLNFTFVPSLEDADLRYIPQLSKCTSKHLEKWTGVFYTYKGLLLLFGVYMAWETRNVKIPALNDSQYIGMNIYNVVLMSITVVVISNLIGDRPTLSYTVVSALIILSTTGMLLLLFLPKIFALLKHNGAPVITSSGLKVEANTRRFVSPITDKKETFYRAEVQNRVYKRELMQLNVEICRLEQLLSEPLEPYPALSEQLLALLPELKPETSSKQRTSQTPKPKKSLQSTNLMSKTNDYPVLNNHGTKIDKIEGGYRMMSYCNSNYLEPADENTEVSSNTAEEFYQQRAPSSPRTTTIRRQESQDGAKEEKQSLLNQTEPESVESQQKTMVLVNSASGDAGVLELSDLTSEGSTIMTAASIESSDQQQIPKSSSKTAALSEELKKIQGRLQSLGDVEFEISYV